MPRDPKSDVLQLNLSRYHSLDVVRLPKSRKYRVVFAERFGVQRRAFVEISFDEAAKLALFLANIEDGMRIPEDREETTDPSRPSVMPPQEVISMLPEDEPIAPPLPEIPSVPRTRSRNPSLSDAIPRAPEDDPRTGVIPAEYLDKKPSGDD